MRDLIIKNLSARIDPDVVKALVVLRQNYLRGRIIALFGTLQHGHRGNALTIALISRMRMVAIEFGMWRSGRKGGASGPITAGYRKLREQCGGA